jgi:hypothetical protein
MSRDREGAVLFVDSAEFCKSLWDPPEKSVLRSLHFLCTPRRFHAAQKLKAES